MDEKIIFSLIDKFNSSSMTELEFHDGGLRLSLRKDGGASDSSLRQTEHKPRAAENANSSVRLTIPVDDRTLADDSGSGGGEYIKSPIVGVFYASSEPDAPPFVKAGSTVKAGQILCVLEAMKMMNKLESEFDCEIVAVKAFNGEMVEYGQVLFEVKKL
jgi:acetyl-CoA carboxylase biotin carboxyl carrier protein